MRGKKAGRAGVVDTPDQFFCEGAHTWTGNDFTRIFCKVAGAEWGLAALPRSPLVLWGIANTWLVLMLVLKMLVFKEKIVDPLGSTENDGYSVQAERIGRLWARGCSFRSVPRQATGGQLYNQPSKDPQPPQSLGLIE